MNVVTLQGRLTRDPDLRVTQSNKEVAVFNVAINESYIVNGEEKQVTAFVNCVAWNKEAATFKDAHKGDLVSLVGKIGTRSYEKDGEKRYVTEINVKFAKLDAKVQTSNFDEFEEIPF